MSNYRAIATVTATIQHLLDAAVSADVPGAKATIVRPDAGAAAGLPDPGVNVFLYQVTPNGAYRNEDLPTRSSDGRSVQRPRVGLDLHYLLTFYGSDTKFEPQMVLGTTLRELHAKSVLTGDLIEQALDANLALKNPPALSSDLAADVERVKLTQTPLSLEELSKLWSVMFQTSYQLSVAFQGSVVLIEAEQSYSTGVPVLARTVYVATLRAPLVQAVVNQTGDADPITAGSSIEIRGRNFSGDGGAEVFVDGSKLTISGLPSDAQLTAPLPPLDAGIHGLVVKRVLKLGIPAADHDGWQSGVFPFVLTPTINIVGGAYDIHTSNPSSRTVNLVTYDSADVTVGFTPAAGPNQRLAVVLNPLSTAGPSYTFAAKPGTTGGATQVTIRAVDVIPGTYLVRLEIDGVQTPLEFNGVSYDKPTVTL